MIALAWGQPYVEFFAEAASLVKDHWDEVGAHRDIISLNPDHNRYIQAERLGMLRILTARDQGKMVGYFMLMVMPHPRDKGVTIGAQELIYASPDYRSEMLGIRLSDAALQKCEEIGVNIAFFRQKADQSDAYLRRRGFEKIETTHTKVLRAPGSAT